MTVFLMASRKGGSGKTTLAIHFAVVAGAMIVDCDPQGSAAYWRGVRSEVEPSVVTAAPLAVRGIIAEAAGQLVIIDSAPHDERGLVTLMQLADFVIIPLRPGPLDVAAIGSTVDIARAVKRPFVCVINAAPPRVVGFEPSIVVETREALAAIGAPCLRPYVAQRIDLSHALIGGKGITEHAPGSRAAVEIISAWKAIGKLIDGT